MGATSSPDPTIAPFESGMPRLVPQSAILSRGTLPRCGPLLTLPMGATSSPDPTIAPFESGMPRLVPQSAILSRGTLGWVTSVAYSPDGRHIISGSSDDHSFESGMPRLVLQSAILSRGTLARCGPLLTLPMGATSSPDPRSHHSNLGCQDWCRSRRSSQGAHCTRCRPLLTLPMGATSSPDPPITPFESGMPRLVLQSANPLKGHTDWVTVRCLLSRWAPHHLRILRSHHSNLGCQDWCCSRRILSRGTLDSVCQDCPLLTLPMGATSSPDPTIAPFESGMPRLVLQSAILSRGTLARCVRCLLSRWAPHHLRILRSHHSNLGCQDWCCSRRSSQGAH
jgi:hypothetical protein